MDVGGEVKGRRPAEPAGTMSLKHKGDQRGGDEGEGGGRSGQRGKEPFSLSPCIVRLLPPFLSSYL